MSTKLDSILQTYLSDLSCSLQSHVEKAFSEEHQRILEENGLHEQIQKSRRLKNKIARLEQEQEALEAAIKIGEGLYQGGVPLHLSVLGCSGYRVSDCEVAAYRKVAERKEGKNFLAFHQLKEDIERTYDLAINAKEKRTILLSLQQRNWSDLGITPPRRITLDAFEIKNGELLPAKPALPPKNK